MKQRQVARIVRVLHDGVHEILEPDTKRGGQFTLQLEQRLVAARTGQRRDAEGTLVAKRPVQKVASDFLQSLKGNVGDEKPADRGPRQVALKQVAVVVRDQLLTDELHNQTAASL